MADKSQKKEGGNEIPGMELNEVKNPNAQPQAPPQNQSQNQQPSQQPSKEEIEQIKKEIEPVKKSLTKKYNYIQSISILPPQSIPHFIEEELSDSKELPQGMNPKELENYTHINIIVSNEQQKQIPKVKEEAIKQVGELNRNFWIHVRTPNDVWEICLDQKFELSNAIGMSFPIYDKGILAGLRVAEIHKSMVVQKFEKYVVSYVISGSLVRGDVTKESDVDVFVVINDTDVKKMPRMELRDRLRNIIYQYVSEAMSVSGAHNQLEPQIYLLTDFWENVKDAHPVMFTFIRDGVPLYDRGTFMPWKTLLKMGRLKPSPEAIDMFMSAGDNTTKRSKKALLDIVVHDIYWGVLTPSQALLMLNGNPPPTPKEVVSEMERVFVKEEKMLEKKYLNILHNIVINYYKAYERGKLNEVSGKEVDKLLKDMNDFLTRMKELREQIEKRTSAKTIERVYDDVINLLKSIVGNYKSEKKLQDKFEEEFVKTGKFTQQHSRILKEVFHAKREFNKGKSNIQEVDRARKNATILTKDLSEYAQRQELESQEKIKIALSYKEGDKEKTADLYNCENASYMFKEREIKKVTSKGVQDSNLEEANNAIKEQRKKASVEFDPKILESLKKELGEFKISL
ncbi:MAG: nucleotidyltransferase domain-containing protein [Candidatus Pacearchaeota archaeon]